MNILFIGGSNLVIKQGISTLIPECLSSAGISVDNVYNIAVGATPCLFGLENFTLFKKKEVDLVFVEYGINDLPLFTNDKVLWERSFHSLLSLIRERYPKAHLVTIILGRQKDRFWKNQQRMHQKMIAISENLGILVVNIDQILKQKIEDFGGFEKFYLDDSHYRSPHVTRFISELVVAEYKLNKSLGFFKPLSLENESYQPLNVYGLPGLVRCFENSKFHKQTTILNKNESIELEIRGKPVAVSFISTSDSCSLLVESNGFKRIINTKRKKSGKFSFILKQIPLYSSFSLSNANSEYQTIKLTAIDETSENWKEDYVQRTYGMESSQSLESKVYISHISSF